MCSNLVTIHHVLLAGYLLGRHIDLSSPTRSFKKNSFDKMEVDGLSPLSPFHHHPTSEPAWFGVRRSAASTHSSRWYGLMVKCYMSFRSCFRQFADCLHFVLFKIKNTALIPTVLPHSSPHQGYVEGERINDHEVALAYIMEGVPLLLPSYTCLEPGQRAPISFHSSKEGFQRGLVGSG